MSGAERRRVAFSTKAVIELFERAGPASRQLAHLVESCRAAGSPVMVSGLAFAEVLVKPLKLGWTDDVEACERRSAVPHVVAFRSVDREVLGTSARLKAFKIGLKLRDAIHSATAPVGGADVLLTSDPRLGWSLALDGQPKTDAPILVDPVAVDVTTLVERP